MFDSKGEYLKQLCNKQGGEVEIHPSALGSWLEKENLLGY